MERLEDAFKQGCPISKEIIESYAQAEFFTKLPEVDEEIEVVTFVAGIGDISTDLLSPGADAHSCSDRELHGQSMFEQNKDMQNELLALKEKHPNLSFIQGQDIASLVYYLCTDSAKDITGSSINIDGAWTAQ